jgi:hypothetical protein
MPTNSFDEIWIPRIGRDATNELRHNGRLTLVFGPTLVALAIGCSFAFGSSKPEGIAVGSLCIAMAVTLSIIWIRSRMSVAAALSSWFGVRIAWNDLPRMRSSQFDAWCKRRNLKPRVG